MTLQIILVLTCFTFALGLCVGSFLNVVIWRLPNSGREVLYQQKRGPLTLSWPPSHCPVCDAPIRWYQNIPVVSWMFLKARCANCNTQIPVRYPLVELSTGLLFAGIFLSYFVGHWQGGFHDPRIPHQAAALGYHLVLAATLLAVSAIDADLFIIPLALPWFLAVVGVLGAAFIDHPIIWKIPEGSWWLARPILGGTIGLAIANLLLKFNIMPRSFTPTEAEVAKFEAEARAEAEKNASDTSEGSALSPPPKLSRFGFSIIATAIILLLIAIAWATLSVKIATLLMVIAAIVIFLIGVLPRDDGQTDVTDEVLEEISHPKVRREMLKEILFLAIPVICGIIAYFIPIELPHLPWVARVLGSLLGLLAGGGVIWIVRVFGTLGFNKEAMGMGDAHLMAGVGAIIGAPLVVFAFFLSAFIGALWSIFLLILRRSHILPYGPWLSVASILSLLIGNPFMAWYLP